MTKSENGADHDPVVVRRGGKPYKGGYDMTRADAEKQYVYLSGRRQEDKAKKKVLIMGKSKLQRRLRKLGAGRVSIRELPKSTPDA